MFHCSNICATECVSELQNVHLSCRKCICVAECVSVCVTESVSVLQNVSLQVDRKKVPPGGTRLSEVES